MHCPLYTTCLLRLGTYRKHNMFSIDAQPNQLKGMDLFLRLLHNESDAYICEVGSNSKRYAYIPSACADMQAVKGMKDLNAPPLCHSYYYQLNTPYSQPSPRHWPASYHPGDIPMQSGDGPVEILSKINLDPTSRGITANHHRAQHHCAMG